MRRKTIALTTTLLLALSLTACDTKDKGEITPAQSETTQSAPAEDETAPEPETTNPKFGDTYTWPDGVALTISAPQEFTPGEYAAGTVEGQPAVAYDITINNGGDKDIESIIVYITGTSGGQEIKSIFDSENGIDVPQATILPGQSLTWKVAYSVADPSDITMTVAIQDDFSRDKVHFTS